VFLALLLVVMFGPLHRWFLTKCRGYNKIAAMLTTVSILVLVLVPLLLLLVEAAFEAQSVYKVALDGSAETTAASPGETPQGEAGSPI